MNHSNGSKRVCRLQPPGREVNVRPRSETSLTHQGAEDHYPCRPEMSPQQIGRSSRECTGLCDPFHGFLPIPLLTEPRGETVRLEVIVCQLSRCSRHRVFPLLQLTADALDVVDGLHPHLILVVSVKVRPVVWRAWFGKHPDDDSVEPSDLRLRLSSDSNLSPSAVLCWRPPNSRLPRFPTRRLGPGTSDSVTDPQIEHIRTVKLSDFAFVIPHSAFVSTALRFSGSPILHLVVCRLSQG
jgi:hypothetical protein